MSSARLAVLCSVCNESNSSSRSSSSALCWRPTAAAPAAAGAPAGADALSRYIDWRDRATCILFGDGCGAVLLQAREDGQACGLLGMDMHSGEPGLLCAHDCSAYGRA